MRHLLRITGGFCLIAIGLVGLILPIMPGWVFVIPGLILLADYFPPIRRLLDWAKAKLEGSHPDLFHKSATKRASE
jgi:uncharacterized membrane protein YbaN (DUF454 family)